MFQKPKGGPVPRASLSGCSEERLAAGVDLCDPGRPVGEDGPGAPTAAAGREVLAQVAGLRDVLGGKPDIAPVDHRRAVVTPSRPGRVGRVVYRRPAEAVGRSGTECRDLDCSNTAGVDRREGRARVEVTAD